MEKVIDTSVSNKYLLAAPPKKWSAYIIKFLDKKLHAFFIEAQIKVCYTQSFYLFLKYYIYTTRKEICLLSKRSRAVNITKWGKENSFTEFNETLPVGYLARVGHLENIKPKEKFKEYYYHIHTWKFILAKELRLKVTFHYISISYNVLQVCYIGNVMLRSFTKSTNASEFIYCGMHSNIDIYPEFENVDVKVSLRPYVSYNVTFSFEVIDQNRIITYSYNLDEKPTKLVGPYCFVQTKTCLVRYHIETDKFKILTFYVQNWTYDAFQIHDGPGTLSELLNTQERMMYVSSTFQCLVNIFQSFNKSYHSPGRIHYLTENNSAAENIILNTNTSLEVKYPSEKALSNKIMICNVSTEIGTQINVSVTYFRHSYTWNDLCTYGGLVVLNSEAIHNVCWSEDGVYQHRNIYSNQSKAIIIIYSYIQYGTLNITIRLSSTQCELGDTTESNIYLCTYTNICTFSNYYMKACKKMQVGIDYNTKISSKINRGDYGGVRNNQRGCVIIQFSQEIDLYLYKIFSFVRSGGKSMCGIHTFYHLKEERHPLLMQVVNYSVTGMFKGNSFLNCSIQTVLACYATLNTYLFDCASRF